MKQTFSWNRDLQMIWKEMPWSLVTTPPLFKLTSDLTAAAVFLRLLEYYEGILFLTTNRIDTFDTAFKSRIHLAIKYDPLSFETRRDLWQSFIKSTSQSIRPNWLDDAALNELASKDLNGRQIKNIVRTAHALAVSAGESLRMTHLDVPLNAMKLFEMNIAEDTKRDTGLSRDITPRKRLR